MLAFVKRAVLPVVRLTTVEEIDHEATFGVFAQTVGRAVLERRVREHPRVVSFPMRAVR